MPSRVHASASTGFSPGLVAAVLDRALAHRVRVQGIAGLQGSGKSTLAAQVVALARARGLHAVAVSLDDFYLGRRERLARGRRIHPLLATRGPPGSHDLALAVATLDALRDGQRCRVPRFDKLSDRRLPPSRWRSMDSATDLLLFEGWFLKTPPQSADALREPVNALEREADPGGQWRTWCNDALCDYAPLWSRIDRLLFLQPPGFEIVPGWRWQQERRMQAVHPRRGGMDRHAIERFVMAFERVSRHALATLPAIAEDCVRLDAKRRPLD